jgi:hypothetical protein
LIAILLIVLDIHHSPFRSAESVNNHACKFVVRLASGGFEQIDRNPDGAPEKRDFVSQEKLRRHGRTPKLLLIPVKPNSLFLRPHPEWGQIREYPEELR